MDSLEGFSKAGLLARFPSWETRKSLDPCSAPAKASSALRASVVVQPAGRQVLPDAWGDLPAEGAAVPGTSWALWLAGESHASGGPGGPGALATAARRCCPSADRLATTAVCLAPKPYVPCPPCSGRLLRWHARWHASRGLGRARRQRRGIGAARRGKPDRTESGRDTQRLRAGRGRDDHPERGDEAAGPAAEPAAEGVTPALRSPHLDEPQTGKSWGEQERSRSSHRRTCTQGRMKVCSASEARLSVAAWDRPPKQT